MNANNIQTARDAYRYARDVIKGRFLEGEPLIATDLNYSYRYARNILKGRWVEGEPIIATDPVWAYYYAKNVIKGRWLEGELVIMFSKYYPDYAELCGMNQYECQ
jgi:hypothetical protein